MSKSQDRRTVLVVDDDEGLREAIAADFELQGYRVFSASNGTEAFAILQEQEIEVVISDIQMPGGDGISLLKQTRGLHPKTPVFILITGYADISIDQAYNQGADGVFTKPYSRKNLFAAIQRALKPESERWKESENKSESNQCLPVELPLSTLKFGRGGMFVELERGTPGLDIEVSFKLDASSESHADFNGTGIIRWIRTTPTLAGKAGLGIEFVSLSDGLRDYILKKLKATNAEDSIPYIPAG